MGRFVVAYLDGWRTGNPIPIHIPSPFSSTAIPITANLTIETATAQFSMFDHTYTYIVKTETNKTQWSNCGFTDVHMWSEYSGHSLYIAENNYITFSATYNFEYYLNNVQFSMISAIGSNVQGSTIPCNNSGSTGSVYIANRRVNDGGTRKFEIQSNGTSVSGSQFIEFWNSATVIGTDPYADGGESDTGRPTGTWDGSSDTIDFPDLPTLSAVSSGFITLFNPTNAQLGALASYMWSSAFDISTFQKIFADPMDCILGLSIVPVAVPNSGAREVKVGNIGTGVTMNVATSQYVVVSCGSLTVSNYSGSYLDYSPYSKAELYLPFVGTHPIEMDEIMGKTIAIEYHVDVLSGSCIAYVKCGTSVLYSFIGQCGSSIPISGNDWTNVINGALNIASSVGTMVATGGLSAPVTASSAIAGMSGVANIGSTVTSMKPSIEKSGSLSGTGGMMGIKKPYLILSRPKQAIPASQNKFIGYPSYVNRLLSDITGYTEVDKIHLENIPATSAELDEIESLLHSGVIL